MMQSPENSGRVMVSVIIVNHNGLTYTRDALVSLQKFSAGSEIIVVDNCSTDGSLEILRREFPSVRVISSGENKGFGFGCNRGAEAAKGEYLFFLNNDTILFEDTPAMLATFLENNQHAAVCGPRLNNRDGTFQLSFGLDPSIINEAIVRRWQRISKEPGNILSSRLERGYANRKTDWVTGAALMVRSQIFRQLGGFDEKFFMYFEDADFCRRVRNLGFDVVYVPKTSLTHFAGQSARERAGVVNKEYRRSQLLYYRKHGSTASVGMLRLFLLLRGGS